MTHCNLTSTTGLPMTTSLSDDVKAANEALVESMVQQLRDCVSVGDEMTLDHASLIDDAADWIEGEPQRIAAAVAKEREEQREADLDAIPSGAWGVVDYRMGVDDARREIRNTPLTATPLADENAALRERVAELEVRLGQAERDAAADEARGNYFKKIAEEAEAERDEAVKALRAVRRKRYTSGYWYENDFVPQYSDEDRQEIRNAAVFADAVLAKYPEGT